MKKSPANKSKVVQDRISQPDAIQTPPLARSDNPIRRSEDDALGRLNAARSFALQVLSLDASEGLVVGVLGPWGSGKTSFVNIARPHFENAAVPLLEFNPWMFSGAQQLLTAMMPSFYLDYCGKITFRKSGSLIRRIGICDNCCGTGIGWCGCARWQRGSNENTNGLLRQYFPKSTDLTDYSQSDLNKVALRLNQRPRQTLGLQTPASKLQQSVASTH